MSDGPTIEGPGGSPDGPRDPSRRSFFQVAAGTAVAGAGLAGIGVAVRDAARDSSTAASSPAAPPAEFELRVNGRGHRMRVPPQRSLLLAIREDLGLTGTKKGCNLGQCGACTVLLDGDPVYSCFMLAAEASGHEITTIEGLERGGRLHPVQQAFIDRLGSQCGHCTSGMVMSGVALLGRNPTPSAAEVRHALSGNLCRCGNYANEVAAVLLAADRIGGRAGTPAAGVAGEADAAADALAGTAQPSRGRLAGAPEHLRYLPWRGPAVDGYEKATGRARYTGDLGFHADDEVRGALFMKVVRSPHPHAWAESIDDSAARGLPGYVGLITWRDVPGLGTRDVDSRDRQCMNHKARYVGDAVAAVVARDQYTAQQALERVHVRWRVLEAYVDPEYVLAHGIDAIHAGGPVAGFGGAQPADTPTTEFREGDVERGMREADRIVEGRYTTQIHSHVQIEPHCCIARWTGGKLTVWDSQQSVFHAREVLAEVMQVEPGDVRVDCRYLGGGFGGKCLDTTGKSLYQGIAAIAARKFAQPVRCEYTLREQIYAEDTRNPFIFYLRTGVKRDGTLTAIECRAIQATGGYASSGPAVAQVAGEGIINTYRCANFWFRGWSVYTNSPVGGEFRGFGHPQAVFARERHMDDIAAALGIDPVELRLRNSKETGDPGTFAVDRNLRLGNVAAKECLRTVAREIGWERREPPSAKRGRTRRGLGVRYSQEHSGRGASDGLVWIDREGRVHVPTGIGNIGTVAHTGIGLVVAEALAVPLEQVEVTWADTADVAWDFVTDASRSLHCNGKAFYNAAVDAARQLREAAARRLGAAAEDLELVGGAVAVRGQPGRRASLRELVSVAPARTEFDPYFDAREDVNPLLNEATGDVNQRPPMQVQPATLRLARELVARGCVVGLGHYVWKPSVQSWGASAAEVEVDMLTGQVNVLKLVAAHDCGRVVFRTGAEAQVMGGTIMSLGFGMTEQVQLDPNTFMPITHDLYLLRPPTALDYPEIVPFLLEAPVDAGPFGAKGLGENPMFNAAAAIGNAIFDATGVPMNDLPYRLPRVERALRRT